MCELVLPKVTVILRGYETKQVLTVVEQLVGTKVNSIEVASNSPHAMESIAAARKEFGAEVHVGAGTVKNAELARQAIAAGAEFMLSPIMFTQEIFDLAKEAGVITVPAAFSPHRDPEDDRHGRRHREGLPGRPARSGLPQGRPGAARASCRSWSSAA